MHDPHAATLRKIWEASHIVHRTDHPETGDDSLEAELRASINQIIFYETLRQGGYRDEEFENLRLSRLTGSLRQNLQDRLPELTDDGPVFEPTIVSDLARVDAALAFDEQGFLPPGDHPMTFPGLRRSILMDGPSGSDGWDRPRRVELLDNFEMLVGQLWGVRVDREKKLGVRDGLPQLRWFETRVNYSRFFLLYPFSP